MKITCPHCGYEHNVSEKITAWSDCCWGCKKFFDWRPYPIVAPRPIPATKQGVQLTWRSRAKVKVKSVAGVLQSRPPVTQTVGRTRPKGNHG